MIYYKSNRTLYFITDVLIILNPEENVFPNCLTSSMKQYRKENNPKIMTILFDYILYHRPGVAVVLMRGRELVYELHYSFFSVI